MNLDARLDDKDAEVAADVTSDAIYIIADDDNDCSKSLGSTSSADADSDEPKEMYADLAGLKRGKITRSLTSWIRRKTSSRLLEIEREGDEICAPAEGSGDFRYESCLGTKIGEWRLYSPG